MESYCEHSILEVCQSNREILDTVYERALALRPESKISYRPLTEHPYLDMVGNPGADFAQFYPGFGEGDFAYLSSCMDGLFERKMIINLKNCRRPLLCFNGEEQKLVKRPDGSLDAEVVFKKGQNRLLLRVTAEDGNFGAMVLPLIPELRMGPGMYVYSSWQYIETEGFRGQSGVRISRLYHKGEPAPQTETDVDWVFPAMPLQSNEKRFDFAGLCGSGKAAYCYTCVCGKIAITHDSPVVIFENGRESYRAPSGVYAKTFTSAAALLIKSVRAGGGWGFSAVTEGEHSLPFIDGADCPDLQWMWIGPFGRGADPDETPYAPENHLQFEEPYPSVNGPAYWRFYRENTYLKQYMHSAFYGQWFYPLMVGANGLRQAAQKLGKSSFHAYFTGWMRLLCHHRNYGKFDTERSEWGSYLPIGATLDRLDPVGTIGMNVAEYYMTTGDEKAQYLLQLLADSLCYEVPRFEDGTFHRQTTMWTDDMYMCLPFLARLGAMTGEERYFDDILTQVRGFYKRLYMKEQDLFSHIYFVQEQKPNRIPWGRGNGWVLLALSEALLLMPEYYHGRGEILKIFQNFARGVLSHRDRGKGIWHQIVNRPESYLETSGSAMFITALARGVRCGWIERGYLNEVADAWNALAARCIDTDGNVYGVCMGSGCNMEEKYYLNLGTIVNDDHGVGIVLGACVEVMNMLDEKIESVTCNADMEGSNGLLR